MKAPDRLQIQVWPGHATTAYVRAAAIGETNTILAQAEGYRLMLYKILSGDADRDPKEFLSRCKSIASLQAEKGA